MGSCELTSLLDAQSVGIRVWMLWEAPTQKENKNMAKEWTYIVPVAGCGKEDVKVTATEKPVDWSMFGGTRKEPYQVLDIRAKSSVLGLDREYRHDLIVPRAFDAFAAKASVKNGVLTLTVPEKPSATPPTTPIQVS